MVNVTITIDQATKLIAAMNRLAEALENKQGGVSRENETIKQTHEATLATEPRFAEAPAPEVEEKPITLEQVRAVLAAKSQAGKKAAVGELLQRYGATKLTAVDPNKFADLLHDAESL